jgi:hypothetical protein
MSPALAEAVSRLLDERLRGLRIQRVRRPDAWTLGLQLQDGATLGLCWEPSRSAVGLCSWVWPKGTPPGVLKTHLASARILGVTSLAGESLLQVALAGTGAASLVWEPLGRSGNCLLLGEEGRILWAARVLGGEFRTGQPGSLWFPPPARRERAGEEPPLGDPGGYLTGRGAEDLRTGLLERGRRAALAALARREKALRRRREAVLGDRNEGEAWAALSGPAQALLASGGLNRRGEGSRRVTDYGCDPPRELTVELDPARTVLENAQLLFKRAQKGQARLRETGRILERIEDDLRALRAERAGLEGCEDLARLFPGSERVSPRPAPQRRRELPAGVAAVPLPQEYAGYAGKNAQANDHVSFRMGRGSDFWFHAEDYHGCHVVVKNPRRLERLPHDVEQAAARYAAEHSGAKPGSTVAVLVSQCKHLRRVTGSPGLVMVGTARRLFVDLPWGG